MRVAHDDVDLLVGPEVAQVTSDLAVRSET
jgi:hypothetical protein